MRPLDLLRAGGNPSSLAGELLSSDFTDWSLYLEKSPSPFKVAVWGTVLAVVCRTVRNPEFHGNLLPWWVRQPMRRLMDACRAINEMVFAHAFVVAVGSGTFCGVLALWVHTTASWPTLFRGSGGHRSPAHGGHPGHGRDPAGGGAFQGHPAGAAAAWVSFSLYRFESNVRSARGRHGRRGWNRGHSVETIRGFYFAQTCAIMIFIVLTVTVVDLISQRLRALFFLISLSPEWRNPLVPRRSRT